LDGKEPFKDEVALWKVKERARYADGYVRSRNGSLSEDSKKELRKRIEAVLRIKEGELKTEYEKPKVEIAKNDKPAGDDQ
jgi:hypothetical protein